MLLHPPLPRRPVVQGCGWGGGRDPLSMRGWWPPKEWHGRSPQSSATGRRAGALRGGGHPQRGWSMPHRGDAAAAAVTAAGNRKAWSSIEGQDGGHAAVSAADNNRLGGNTPAPARSGGGRGAAAGAGVAGAAAHGSGKRGRGSRRRWQEKSRHSSPRQRRRERKGCRRWRWWRSAVAEGEGSRPLVAAPAARAGRRPAPVTRCGGLPGIVITWVATGRASGRVE